LGVTPQAHIRALGKKWIKKFRLEDWKIHFEYHPELQNEGVFSFAETAVYPHARWANIKVYALDDLENTIVHELLHCVLTPLDHNHEERLHIEQVICTLSAAYVGTKVSPPWEIK
jgi:hypothetical protein